MDQPAVTERNSADRSDNRAGKDQDPEGYRVLARKYRPTTFGQLIGQDALVRTLTNAITSGRLAHGYMLTGVRGVGKTTTARLIARALNCVGSDCKGGPTPEPCGACVHCKAIAEDRHVDVLEMDAASRTGIDDIRELLDGVRYRPVTARYKIYIVDEVHMLSEKAFNALLKTLEEPPEHVKFIFATTEIRKVPVTVLSRCQRFDLRRIESADLQLLFREVSKREGATVDDGALALIARAADGSARDGLSILDQAISQAGGEVRKVTEVAVRDMLGLADRALVFELLEAVMRGEVKVALDLLAAQYAAGASPIVVLQDLLELVHWLTRMKVTPESANDPTMAETERTRGVVMAGKLAMPVLTRSWQMLLKGLGEARAAPMPLQAVEMVLVRMTHAAELPTPAEALKALESNRANTAPRPHSSPALGGGARAVGSGAAAASATERAPRPMAEVSLPVAAPAAPQFSAMPQSLAAAVDLFTEKREAVLATQLKHNVRLVRFESGLIEFNPDKNAARDLAGQVGKLLTQWTGQRWVAGVVNAAGQATLHEQELEQAKSDPLVKSILEAFPGATVEAVRRE